MVAMRNKRSLRQRRNGGHNKSRRNDSVLDRVKGGASGIADVLRDGARSATESLKRTTSEATRAIVDTVMDEADEIFDQQKQKAASSVKRISKLANQAAHALHAVKADGLAEYLDDAGERVLDATDYLQDHDLDELLEDAGEFLQRNPALAAGVLFVAGFALARFLKASASREDGDEDFDEEDDERGSRRGRRRQ